MRIDRRSGRAVLVPIIATFAVALACAQVATGATLTQEQLDRVVSRAAQDGNVESVEVAEGSSSQAQTLLAPQTAQAAPAAQLGAIAPEGGRGEVPVSVVVLHGHFVDTQVSLPRRAKAPQGSVLSYTVDTSGNVVAEACCTRTPDLTKLGAVEHLALGAGNATVARRHRTVRRHRAYTSIWGGGCAIEARPENRHCYMIAEWEMHGSERVQGTQEEQDVAAMNVPEWWRGEAFVSDEEWVGFPGERWTEIGTIGGAGHACCSLEWFWGASYGPNNLYVVANIWGIPFNEWANYGMVSAGGGSWCYTIGPHWETTYTCTGGMEPTSQELEVGMETSAESEPLNAAKDLVNAKFMNGAYYNWNKAEAFKSTSHLCYSHYGSNPGDINYTTC